MQRIQQKKEEVWAESQEILQEISEINSAKKLILCLPILQILQENAVFLKIAEEIDSENFETEMPPLQPSVHDIEDQLDMEESALPEPLLDKLDAEYFLEQQTDNEPVNPETTFAEEISEDVEHPLTAEAVTPQDQHSEAPADDSKRTPKIKLAHIKGLHVESLFGDEPVQKPSGTAEISDGDHPGKQKQDFKLDLNDRMAFSKMLFGGSQSELNETIRRLNTYQTLDEAKQYLSEVYYERNWKKADEYAQRLWSLVEHKFL